MKLKTLCNKLFYECKLKIYDREDNIVFNDVIENLNNKDLLKCRVDSMFVKNDILIINLY